MQSCKASRANMLRVKAEKSSWKMEISLSEKAEILKTKWLNKPERRERERRWKEDQNKVISGDLNVENEFEQSAAQTKKWNLKILVFKMN